MNFNEYQSKTKETWIPSKENERERIVLGICGESGEIAEKVKKALRGDKILSADEISKEIGDVLYYLARLCDNFNVSLDDVASDNIIKLLDRKENNKIKGDGDNR